MNIEEMRAMNQVKRISPELKMKRIKFNSKRFRTQPNSNRVPTVQYPSPCTSKMNFYLNATTNAAKIKDFFYNKRPSTQEQLVPSALLKRRSSKCSQNQIFPKYTGKQCKPSSMKSCRDNVEGYVKRYSRIKEDHQIRENLFKDSTKYLSDRQPLNHMITKIGVVLRKNIPQSRLVSDQSDGRLLTKDRDFCKMLNLSACYSSGKMLEC